MTVPETKDDVTIIGIEWNPEFPDLRFIDGDGNPLSLSHEELCNHPLWKDLSMDHVPTIYYKHPGRDIDSGIWRVWVSALPQEGFESEPSFCPSSGISRYMQYLIICWLYNIELTVWEHQRCH